VNEREWNLPRGGTGAAVGHPTVRVPAGFAAPGPKSPLGEYEALMDSLQQGVVLLDRDGAILDINPAGCRLHGLDRSSALGLDYVRSPRWRVAGPDGEELTERESPASRVLRGETVNDCQVRIIDGPSARYWIASYSGAPYRGAPGWPASAAMTFSDVTDRYLEEHRTQHESTLAHGLVEVMSALGDSDHLEEGMDHALMLACSALSASGATIHRREPGGWLTLSERLLSLARVGVFRSADECPAFNQVECAGAPLFVPDVAHSGRGVPVLAGTTACRSYMCLPLVVHDRVSSVLTMYFDSARSGFTIAECDFALRLADALAVAEERASWFARERRTAQSFQAALGEVPHHLPGLEIGYAYHPVAGVSNLAGDCYDAFPLEDGRVAFSIADVSGRGLSAAAAAAFVRDAIRTCAIDRMSPARVLSKVNRLLMAFAHSEFFAAVLVGFIDPSTGVVVYANGGHPCPLLLGPDGSIRELAHHGPLVGVLEDVRFTNRRATLPMGATLVLYTDSVAESQTGGRAFGCEGVAAALAESRDLRGDDLARAIYRASRQVSTDAPHDDAAILTIRRVG